MSEKGAEKGGRPLCLPYRLFENRIPQKIESFWIEGAEPVSIAFLLDVSGSMRAEDFQPKNRLEVAKQVVADFVGLGAFLPGRVEHRDGRSFVQIELGTLPIQTRTDQALAGATANARGEVTVLLRPDDVIHDDTSPLMAEVVRKAFRGAAFLYTLRLPSGTMLLALVPSHHNHAVGESIGIRFGADHVVTFPAD